MGAGAEAWVTVSGDDYGAIKALILAASLRQVCTAKKLVVITNPEIREDLRAKLEKAFDWVLVRERKCQNFEAQARAQALCLAVFTKCVFISPNMLAINNCDDIFGKYKNFAAAICSESGDVDASIFVFLPDRKYLEVADSLMQCYDDLAMNFGKDNSFGAWLKNNIRELEQLDEKYNVNLSLKGFDQSLKTEISIANFIDDYPLLESGNEILEMTTVTAGPVEQFAAKHCLEIYTKHVSKLEADPDRIFQLSSCKSEPIAIVGLSFRLPGGNNVDEFWSLLSEGRSAIVPVPGHRWTKEHTLRASTSYEIEAGFLSDPINEMDASFFELSPQEAEYLDPQQRLLLEVTWEALEDALIDPSKLKDTRTGIFAGSWTHDYHEMVNNSVDDDFLRRYIGNCVASTAGRLSHVLKTTGPSMGMESGCASGIAAVDMACKYLRSGDAEIAIAAGVNLLLKPYDLTMFEVGFSPDFRCKTFDSNANGFVRAEGCTSLILKRFSDAVRDGDKIWGLIRGTALTQEGISKSMGTPTAQCESLAMQLALKDADVDPNDISYIEAHGTGTAVGDPTEIHAITEAYATDKERIKPLLIGSLKTNIGHTESTSGIAGIIKVLLSLKHEMIPKHLNFDTLNPRIDLDAIPAKIPLCSMPWPKEEGEHRTAGVDSFSITGMEGHAIIEEPPVVQKPQLKFTMERPLHIMKISAKNVESLNALLNKYANMFRDISGETQADAEFADIAYSANTGRATFNHRAVIIAENVEEALAKIEEKAFLQENVQSGERKLCFLFTGQGSQYPNMGKTLYETSPVFKASFDQCDKILQTRYNISLKAIMWPVETAPVEDLDRSLYSQTSIFVVEYCLLKLWESWGIKPDFVLGHSLGEFAAAVAVGALTLENAITLVAERSKLIDNLPRGKMLVIKANRNTVAEAISTFQKVHADFWIDDAALNSPEQTVVAGDTKWVDEFSKFCEGKSLKTTVLAATHAFHSRHVDPMLKAYAKIASSITSPRELNDDCPTYISGMEGRILNANEMNVDYWVRHTREKVNFVQACQVLQEQGCNLFLEVGPQPVLSALTLRNLDGQATCLPSIRRRKEDWDVMLDTLSKLYVSEWKGEVDWKGFDCFYDRNKIRLPFYPFNRRPVWKDYESTQPKMHPLLGTSIPISSEDVIFENTITCKNNDFVMDHAIGNKIIYPGAGFLEMCLAGGHAFVEGLTETFVKPKRPVLLKSLHISSPMSIDELGVCKTQALVSLKNQMEKQDALGCSVQVHRQMKSGKWTRHATAEFFPVVTMLPLACTEKLDISRIQMSWEKWESNKVYAEFSKVGVSFGPKFQSLKYGWMSNDGLLATVRVPNDYEAYMIHPIVADAMIQAVIVWTNRDEPKLTLRVPVRVKQLIWLKEATSPTQFVYCSTDEFNNTNCVLVDESGLPLAYISGIDLFKTTSKLIDGMVEQQSDIMPKLWEEVWRSSPGPMQGYLTHDNSTNLLSLIEDNRRELEERNRISEDEFSFWENIVQATRYFVLRALYFLGWEPLLGSNFSVENVIRKLKIKTNFFQYIRFFLRSMTKQEEFMLKSANAEENNFKFLVQPPSLAEIENRLRCILKRIDLSRAEAQVMLEIAEKLSRILIGEEDALGVLFPPEHLNKISVSKLYEEWWDTVDCLYPMQLFVQGHLESAIQSYNTRNTATGQRPIYRILEIGAGTGVSTKPFLNDIIPSATRGECDIEYYVTDISSSFFGPIEESLNAEQLRSVKFLKYDMEEDPLKQGLCPGYFDLITATQVIHVAKDIQKTLKNIRLLMKQGGMFLIVETLYPDENFTFSFGLLGGYWQFTDTEFRKSHTTLSVEMWKEALTNSGFVAPTHIPLYNGIHGIVAGYASQKESPYRLASALNKTWLIFSQDEHNDFLTKSLAKKFTQVGRNCKIVSKTEIRDFTEPAIKEHFEEILGEIEKIEGIIYLWSLDPSTRAQEQISLPLLSLMQLISKMNVSARIFAVMRGACTLECSEVVDPASATIIGFFKSLGNENVHLNGTYFDLDPLMKANDQDQEVFMNLWMEHKQGCAFRNGLRLYPKLRECKLSELQSLSLPGACDRFQLDLPETRLFSDLEFNHLKPYQLRPDEVEVEVKATALNFRDILTVLKPTTAFYDFNTVGLDFSGVISRVGTNVTKCVVGDCVLGMSSIDSISLPSHRKIPESRILLLPEQMTFAEGVCLPSVFSTAIYCLLNVAKMQKGETVLIHTASGGVGLAAIQLCKHVGVKVIATAGSKRKQAYLRNIGIQHVFHSRTTHFGKDVLEVTGGRGVDIVLNSITGPGFKEASLECLAKGGRFIEMSKLNVWTKEEVKARRPDAFYELVDLTALHEHEYVELVGQLERFLRGDVISPIPYERFDAVNIVSALNFFQKAKHIGKVVCIMPEVTIENSAVVTATPLFNDRSTYLITGGLGGIGFAIATWMLRKGAKHIALIGRNSPKPKKASQIESWNKQGLHVKAFSVDVADKEQLKGLLERLLPEQRFPQLRGIMHAAGVIEDAILEDQSWEKWTKTYSAKVYGSWHLHDLTKDYPLEHFVFFSSVASMLGLPGQTNYCASNAFEDALASYRRSIGLQATSINWSTWGEVGMATEIDWPGIRPTSTAQGVWTIETFLKSQTSHKTVLNADSFSLALTVFPQLQNYLDDCMLLEEVKTSHVCNGNEFWNDIKSCVDRDGRIACFKNLVGSLIRNLLRMYSCEQISDDSDFQTLGVDSLMILELKNGIQKVLGGGMSLKSAELQDCCTINEYSNTLCNILEGKQENHGDILSNVEQRLKLIHQDCNLFQKKVALQKLRIISIDEVQTVLLTGATGNLGPYILADLTQRAQVRNVCCLIRPSEKMSGKEKLLRRLKEFHLMKNVLMEKVTVVEGDITMPQFGLDDHTYFEFCDWVEAVVHCAARQDHVAKYRIASSGSANDSRAVNVLGTLHLLEFACERSLKHFFHASTIHTLAGKGGGENFSSSWQPVDSFDEIEVFNDMGYVMSKHVSDQLVHEAVLKGMLCKAFRFPLLVGDSKTGRVDFEKNHYLLKYLSFLKIGVIHDLSIPLLVMATDHSAKISLDIFFNKNAPCDMYNVVHNSFGMDACMAEVGLAFGIKLEVVTFEKYVEKLISFGRTSPDSAFHGFVSEKKAMMIDYITKASVPFLRMYLEHDTRLMDTEKLSKYAPEYERMAETPYQILMRFVSFLKREGVLAKYGIHTSSAICGELQTK